MIHSAPSCGICFFNQGGATKVLTTSYFIEPDIFWKMEYEKDIDVPIPEEEALLKSCICADSFGEFIYRFCIENSIGSLPAMISHSLHMNWHT